MRLIRTVVQPANIGLSRQLRQSQLIRTSSDLLHQVLIETSNREHGSNIQWFGRSYSTSASSEPLETNNTRRRVSRNERKSMVENFVCRYREMNAGKFPTVTEAKNGVGGSYYLVREILQELIYNSKKVSSVGNTKNGLLEKKVIRKKEISSYTAGEHITPIPKLDFEETSSKNFMSDQEPQCSISVERDESKDVDTVHKNDQKFTLVLEPENAKTVREEDEQKLGDKTVHEDEEKLGDKTVHEEDEQKSDGSQSNAGLQESTEEVSGRESDKVTIEDADHKAKSSVWQNLKSFAHGILDIWKKY